MFIGHDVRHMITLSHTPLHWILQTSFPVHLNQTTKSILPTRRWRIAGWNNEGQEALSLHRLPRHATYTGQNISTSRWFVYFFCNRHKSVYLRTLSAQTVTNVNKRKTKSARRRVDLSVWRLNFCCSETFKSSPLYTNVLVLSMPYKTRKLVLTNWKANFKCNVYTTLLKIYHQKKKIR